MRRRLEKLEGQYSWGGVNFTFQSKRAAPVPQPISVFHRANRRCNFDAEEGNKREATNSRKITGNNIE